MLLNLTNIKLRKEEISNSQRSNTTLKPARDALESFQRIISTIPSVLRCLEAHLFHHSSDHLAGRQSKYSFCIYFTSPFRKFLFPCILFRLPPPTRSQGLTFTLHFTLSNDDNITGLLYNSLCIFWK